MADWGNSVCGHNMPSDLKTYKKMKRRLLKDFYIKLSDEQEARLEGLDSVDAVDRYVHDIIRDSR